MITQRKNDRYPSIARVRLPEVFEGEAVLKDISITGCCIECTVYAGVEPGAEHRIEVLPEAVSHIGKFDLLVEVRWIRPVGYSCDIGFSVLESPKGKLFQRYVDYLNWRSSAQEDA